MIVAVFDFLGMGTYTEYQIENDIAVSPKAIFKMSLSRLLVIPRQNQSLSNRGPYLISKENILVDDFIVQNKLDLSNVHSITKIFLGLQYPINIGLNTFTIDHNPLREPDSSLYGKYLQSFLFEQRRLINLTKKGMHYSKNPDTTVLNIPDWIDDANLDIILNAARNLFTSPILLWNSVAACIGASDEFSVANIAEGCSVLINDENVAMHSTSILKMHAYEGRIIPGHHIYWDSENPNQKRRRTEYYPTTLDANSYDSLSSEFNCSFNNGFLQLLATSNTSTFKQASLFNIPKTDATINLQDKSSSISLPMQPPIFKDVVSFGSALFVQQMRAGLTPYLEECKALYMVTVSAHEEVQLKTLISYTEQLPAGKSLQQHEIYDISLQKGADFVEFNLLFSTETRMEVLRKKLLRSLKQKLNVSDMLLNTPREVPLKLIPTVYAGQGRARIEVRQREKMLEEILTPVYLDWNEMKLTSKTVNKIEEELPRSFPVDIPTVVCDTDKFKNARWSIKSYIESKITNSHLNLAKSTFINQNAEGVEKLRRSSIFGSPKNNGYDMPNVSSDKELSLKLFDKLNKEYQRESNPKILTQIAWTYHGNYFQPIIKEILREISTAAYAAKGVPSQKFTCCANLLTEDQDMISYIKSFTVRLEDPSGISNWCRAAYQILMYNSSFFRTDINNSLTEKDLNECMSRLIYASYVNRLNRIICGNIDKTIYFLFKGRKYHKDFCQGRENNRNYNDANWSNYEALKAVILSPQAAFAKTLIDLCYSCRSNPTQYAKKQEYSNFCALDGNTRYIPTILNSLAVPSKEEWGIFNNWNLWESKDTSYWNLLSEFSIFKLPRYLRNDFESYFTFYENWLVNYFRENKLQSFTMKPLSSKRITDIWSIEIGKILIGKGNLNLPLGEDD